MVGLIVNSKNVVATLKIVIFLIFKFKLLPWSFLITLVFTIINMLNKYIKALEKYFFHAVHLVDSLRNIINRYYFDDLKSILVHIKSPRFHVVVIKSGGSSFKYLIKKRTKSKLLFRIYNQIT